MSKKGDKHWTPEQVQFLKDNYGKTPITDIMARVDRTYQAVRGKAGLLGLVKKGALCGSLNGNWKGGYTRMRLGYLKNNKTEKLLHRENIEASIGRELTSEEIVHHINGDKLNNDVANLYLCKDISQHRKIHYSLEKVAFDLVRRGVIHFNTAAGNYEIAEAFGYVIRANGSQGSGFEDGRGERPEDQPLRPDPA